MPFASATAALAMEMGYEMHVTDNEDRSLQAQKKRPRWYEEPLFHVHSQGRGSEFSRRPISRGSRRTTRVREWIGERERVESCLSALSLSWQPYH